MDKLKQIKLLGEGAFGKCYLCENPADGSKYVVKQIDISNMSAQEKKEAYHEAKVMSAFDHPNIIKFIDVYTTTNGKLNIVMNFADGGDLSSKIRLQRGRLFTESEILDLFVQICLAIKHVHDRKVLHRDIKAQNVFLMKSGLIKLGDFGISKVLSNTIDKARTMVGTPYYLSPEIVENRPYSFKSDVWSLGVLLYELCTLKPPFDGTSIRHLGLNIVRGTYPPIPPHFSKDLKILIAQMLTVDSNRRPTVAQVLRMPFIKSRIQNLLSESTRFEEFSHTILHKQQLFAAKDPKNIVKPAEVKKEMPKQEAPRKETPKQDIPKKEPPRVEVKEVPKPDLYRKEPVRNEIKEPPRPEPPKYIPRKEPPKPEVKDIRNIPKEIQIPKEAVEKNNIYTPKPRVVEVKKVEDVKEVRRPYELQEIPKFNEREARRNIDPRAYDKEIKPKPPPVNYGRLEDVFKPVEKPIQKKVDNSANIQIREELKKKKELEARKKLDEIMQQRENKKLEEIARQEAADKKKKEKLKKIQEEREKMMNDIKQKKNVKNSSQPIIEVYTGLEELNLSEKVSDKPQKEKKEYAEERKKMLDALRHKPKPKKNEFVVEWVGINNPEEKRLYEVLKEAITEESTEEEDIYITEVPPAPIFEDEEELIDRIDEIADKEVIVASEPENSAAQECNPDDNIGSTYNSLEAMREFLEEKMGCKMLLEAYNTMKEIGDIDPHESGYSIFYEKLGTIIAVQDMEEYVSYLRSLIILENNADSYLEGLFKNKY